MNAADWWPVADRAVRAIATASGASSPRSKKRRARSSVRALVWRPRAGAARRRRAGCGRRSHSGGSRSQRHDCARCACRSHGGQADGNGSASSRPCAAAPRVATTRSGGDSAAHRAAGARARAAATPSRSWSGNGARSPPTWRGRGSSRVALDRELLHQCRIRRRAGLLLESVRESSEPMTRTSRTPARIVVVSETDVEATRTHGTRVKRAPRARIRTAGVATATNRSTAMAALARDRQEPRRVRRQAAARDGSRPLRAASRAGLAELPTQVVNG